ncbi:MAG: radical SAM protein [Armatimonadota bacterium]
MALQLSLFEEPKTLYLPDRMGHASVVDRTAKSILSPANGMLQGYDFSLNPYRWCSFGCSYCYAAFFVADKQQQAEWGTWVEVKSNAAELLRRERKLAGAKVYLGSVTDPYQPVEMKTGLTRSLLEVMVDVVPQPRLVIQTRSPLVVRDVDILRKFANVRVNMSVPTDDDTMRKQFEPTAPNILRRMQALKMLRAAKVKTGVCISPMLPLRDPEGFIERIRAVGPERISWSFFHTGQRDFASGTRPGALKIAERLGWNQEAFERTAERLKRASEGMELKAFSPA